MPRIQACGLAGATAEAAGVAPRPGTDPRAGPGLHSRMDRGWSGDRSGDRSGGAERRKDEFCGSVIYPRGYPPRDTVIFCQYFRRKTQLLSTSIWAGGFGGRIDPERGALGARNRRFIGESMALHAIAYASLPNRAMMWDIMSGGRPASLPKPVGYPPIFVIWRRSGGPSKSIYSKVAGISKTNDDN